MPKERITRRMALSGATALVTGIALHPAEASFGALVSGIRTLVTLWNGFKMAEEIYERFFANDSAKLTNELSKYFGRGNFSIGNYYTFGNPHHLSGLPNAAPGCDTSHSICVGTAALPANLPIGFIMALNGAINELRSSYDEERILRYTRPVNDVMNPHPWQDTTGYSKYLKTEMRYRSNQGAVGLRWMITDPIRHTSYGDYIIRDDDTGRIVAAGRTADFEF